MKKINILAALLFLATMGFSQQGIFLEVGALQGDQAEGQTVLAYSGGISNSGSIQTGGGGAGKANLQDISATLTAGKMSMAFLESVTKGTHFPEMKLKFYNLSKKLYYQITLTDVLVSSVSFGGSCGTNPCATQTENVSLSYSKIKWEDFANGTSYEFNIATNTGN